METIAIGRSGPRQQHAGTIFAQATTAHAFGNQSALIFSNCAANLQQQLIMGILAHRPIKKFNLTIMSLKFLDQQHLMHIVARQAIGRGQQDSIKVCGGRSIA